jgi:hypothetical protein
MNLLANFILFLEYPYLNKDARNHIVDFGRPLYQISFIKFSQ